MGSGLLLLSKKSKSLLYLYLVLILIIYLPSPGVSVSCISLNSSLSSFTWNTINSFYFVLLSLLEYLRFSAFLLGKCTLGILLQPSAQAGGPGAYRYCAHLHTDWLLLRGCGSQM